MTIKKKLHRYYVLLKEICKANKNNIEAMQLSVNITTKVKQGPNPSLAGWKDGGWLLHGDQSNQIKDSATLFTPTTV